MFKSKTARDVLSEARDRIARGWTQGAFARDANGRDVDRASAEAVCWCSVGAITASDDEAARRGALRSIGRQFRDNASNIYVWNDANGRTQAEVLALFDHVIAEEADHV